MLRRSFRLADAAEVTAECCAELAETFAAANGLRSLNVAGPRASKAPQAHTYAYRVVDLLLGRR